jgi:hypothetical protein
MVVSSWLLLTALNVSRDKWPLLLNATRGSLPDNDADYRELCAFVRRQGHMTDRGIDPVKSLGNHHYVTWDSSSEHSHGSGSEWVGETYAFPSFDAESGYASSGHSQAGELDFSDVHGLDDNAIGESLYLAFAFAKRRWRHFQGKGKGKGKKGGKKGKKGKHAGGKNNIFGRRTYLTGEWESSDSGWLSQDDSGYEADAGMHAYKGSMGSGKGSGKRKGNPMGPDGKPLTCRSCGSPDHFAHKCPQQKGSGKSSSSYNFSAELDAQAASQAAQLATI